MTARLNVPHPAIPPELLAAAQATRGRLRLMVALEQFSQWLPSAVLFLTVCAVSYRFGVVSGRIFGGAAVGVSLGLVLWCWRAARRGPGLLDATLRLDAAHALRGRLAAALEYGGLLPSSRPVRAEDEGFVAIVLADARSLGGLSPPGAAPLRSPPGAMWGAAMCVCLGAIVLLPDPEAPPATRVTRAEAPPVQSGTWLEEDDAELLQRASEELKEAASSEEGKDAAARFNEIVLKAVAGEIDQAEAFRLAAELQADLEAAGMQSAELSEGLNQRGASLEKRAVTRALGRALQEKKYEEAEEALKRLAERLASEKEPLTKKELDDLRASVEEMRGEIENLSAADKSGSEARAQEEQTLKERQKQLLNKKNNGTATPSDQQEMQANERRLKQLSRQKKRDGSAQKTLSKLDQELAEAARQLEQEQKKSGEFMEQAARTLSEGVEKQLSEEEKREMIKQLKELKERLRRQNQDGKQAERLREFQKRARGQEGEQSREPSGGKPGQPRPGSGQMRLGPGGVPIPVPGAGEGEQPGQEPGAGKKPGQGHDPNLSGAESNLEGAGTEDTTAVAQDTGAGTSSSETILSVAEEGFTSSAYETLFREYETVAEEVMEKDAVPAGRKAHVLRYFELIRPRGDGAPAQGEK